MTLPARPLSRGDIVGHQFAPKVKKFYNKNNQKTSEAELRLDEIEADFSYSLNLPLIQSM
ncbi:LOW QUALITY PROTEIN: hypothetical protein ACHAXS_010060 [Conticribra weissflogii]